MLTLDQVLARLYHLEVNVHLGSFWDAGWSAQLGDPLNGFRGAFLTADHVGDLAEVLDREARAIIPAYVKAYPV